jgi:RecJ-like exonuclease
VSKCKECNGTGVITLFTSSRKCRCTNSAQLKKCAEFIKKNPNIYANYCPKEYVTIYELHKFPGER